MLDTSVQLITKYAGNLKIKLVDHENVSLFFKSDLKKVYRMP